MITSRAVLFNQIKLSVQEQLSKNLVALGVFGSYARGDYSAQSDLDLFIICRKVPAGRKRYDIIDFDEDHLGVQVNPIILSIDEAGRLHPFYLSFQGGLIIIYDQENLLRQILLSIQQLFQIKAVIEDEEMGVTYWRILDEQKISQRLF